MAGSELPRGHASIVHRPSTCKIQNLPIALMQDTTKQHGIVIINTIPDAGTENVISLIVSV